MTGVILFLPPRRDKSVHRSRGRVGGPDMPALCGTARSGREAPVSLIDILAVGDSSLDYCVGIFWDALLDVPSIKPGSGFTSIAERTRAKPTCAASPFQSTFAIAGSRGQPLLIFQSHARRGHQRFGWSGVRVHDGQRWRAPLTEQCRRRASARSYEVRKHTAPELRLS